MRKNLVIVAAAAVLVVAGAGAAAAGWFSGEELPPPNAMKLSAVIKLLEDQGLSRIEEVEFEDGVWEVEVHQNDNKEVELHVDPLSGKIVKRE
jgi:hypothetical protein